MTDIPKCEYDYPCEKQFNCCDCGTEDPDQGCGCIYCWSCNACDACQNQ